MGIIVPAILPTSYEDLEEKLSRLIGITNAVQIDIVDGKFIGPASWPYSGGSSDFARRVQAGELLPHASDFQFEIDLMVQDPEQVAGMWIAAGATRIIAHAESTNYLPRLITDLEVKYGHDKGFASDLLSFGIALNIDTDTATIEPFLDKADFVQFMGIARIGKQGQPFDTRVLAKIAAFQKKYPDIPVQVDGGVSLASAPLILKAGVSRLVSGSALWKAPDLATAFKKMSALTDEFGIYGQVT